MSSRCRSRPAPGHPSAKVENNLCTIKGRIIRDEGATAKGRGGLSPIRGIYSSIIPRFRPMLTACARSLAPSLESMLATWLLTLASPMDS